jgi:hypothetical protein
VFNPQPVAQCPCIYIPQEQGGSVLPPGTGFFAFYDSQGYGGDILTRFHTEEDILYFAIISSALKH